MIKYFSLYAVELCKNAQGSILFIENDYKAAHCPFYITFVLENELIASVTTIILFPSSKPISAVGAWV
jgi:hypothetical protein